jgi:crotonobetainyl-CoA:carnitine CoA-transferase CaiB-like acyl-CoA transferase
VYDVFEGVRVVEVASWVFMPAAGAIFADWGADVIKVEDPETSDPMRGLSNAMSSSSGFDPNISLVNRGKRSMGINIGSPEGRELLYELIRTADVFMTSYRSSARKHLGIEVSDIRAVNPNIVYARGTGQGSLGPDAHKGGYDLASTWARSGIAHRLTSPGGPPPPMPASIGDLTSAVSLAGAIAAALFRRERTGIAPTVEVSLYGMGMWIMSQSITAAHLGMSSGMGNREESHNPLVNCYETKDGRWIYFVLMQADRFWADLCRRLDRPDLIDDPRFSKADQRGQNSLACVHVLDEIFGSRTLEEWSAALDSFDGVWCPVRSTLEVTQDPQVYANGYFPEVEIATQDGSSPRLVASPMQFDDRQLGTLRPAPDHGADTESILLELGHSWEDIIRLKDGKAIL